MKRFSYLMGQTELFEHFLEIKVSCSNVVVWQHTRLILRRVCWMNLQKERDPEFARMIEEQQAKKDAKGKKKAA
jgi:SWI/SNF-related matrix-associated actin-dependent regulator of chromatin subfamily A member 5